MAYKSNDPNNTIAFQGIPGAYSELACLSNFENMETLSCPSFEDMISSVQENRAKLAMVPVENSTAGRVADIHHLLPESGLYIIGETYFLKCLCKQPFYNISVNICKTIVTPLKFECQFFMVYTQTM